MMAQHSHGTMFSCLLAFLLLLTFTSAMLLPSTSPTQQDPTDQHTTDPNTYLMPRATDTPSDPRMLLRNSDLQMTPPDFTVKPLSYHPGPHTPSNYPVNMTGKLRESVLPVGPGDGSEPNLSFCDLLLEAPVPPPIDQVPWFCVCSRCKSNVGPKGDRGDRGPPGLPGSPGRRGLTGLRGRPGFTGRQGLKGQKGDEGEKGQRGTTGFSGGKGDRGYKGDKGDQGFAGPQGEQGPQGENGICPESCDSVHGPPGVPGLPGSVGARGLPGVAGPTGATGPKGNTGDMGRSGVPGLEGQKGDRGEQGVCNCTDGADGIDGVPGTPGAKGEKGDVGHQGLQGPVGEKGSPGQIGLMGLPGPCSPIIQSAFSASLGLSFPQPNMPIPFPHVLYNRQMHFDPNKGIYRAPVNGTYIFSYHVAIRSKVLKLGLFHNYNPVVKTTEANNRATASHQMLLHLDVGDSVWLQVKDDGNNGMYTDRESSSTFSGFLLHPDSCDMFLTRDVPVLMKGTYSWGDLPWPMPVTEATPNS